MTTKRGQRDHLPSLLLLPFPPKPARRECLNAAYRPSLKAALQKLKDDPSSSRVLIVAIACPILHGPYLRHKTLSWAEAQSLVAGVYTVVSVLCAQLSIATDVDGGAGSVDARVVLVDHGRDRDQDRRFTADDFRPAIEPNSTTIVDLPTFASAYFPWNYVFHPDSEAGHRFYATYMRLAEGNQVFLQEQLVTVQAGVTLNVPDAAADADASSQQTSGYSTVCLGGTFDHLHPGHKLLLTAGAYLLKVPERGSSATCHYIIGVTGDEMLKTKKFVEYVQRWPERARSVIDFLGSVLELSPTGWKDTSSSPKIVENEGDYRATFREGTISVQCVEIQDPFGPTITQEDIEALVVSEETRSGGKAVNDKRVEQGFKALDVFEVDVLDAAEITDSEATKTQDFASKISSTAIRQQKAEAAARAGAS